MSDASKPVVLITGASGNIGQRLCTALRDDYFIVGVDLQKGDSAHASYKCDLTSDKSVQSVIGRIGKRFDKKIAAVIHLAAYFDFTGQDHPLYENVTVQGTRRLLDALQTFSVGRFIYSSTMLVHQPGAPGKKIDESTPIAPGWAYPASKARAEEIIAEHAGTIPFTILRLAGMYDEHSAVPTLSQQIVRIFEKDLKSHLYSGDLMAGQAFIHADDMTDLFVKAVERREKLPHRSVYLAGEEQTMGYQELQNRIGDLLYGAEQWKTFSVPEFIAKPGALLQEHAEPIMPDAFDQGEKPFIRAFMISLASDHYDLDIGRVREDLDWQPRHRIYDGLETLIENLQRDPARWYEENGITLPDWMQTAVANDRNPAELSRDHEHSVRALHAQNVWAHFLNAGLALWLITAPFTLGYESKAMIWSDMLSGVALLFFALLSASYNLRAARLVCALIGLWLLSAPLVFWAPTAAAYLNDTLVGMLVLGFSVLVRPFPGISPVAAETGPTVPPGWDYSPSSWVQRLPIIVLAFIGFFISRYLCAYQLGHIDGIWEPFFAGVPGDGKNGTEEIITSSVSQAWPVPDAGLGALTYALEILTGIMGSARRWRTMPWLVMAFGIMIVPLGAVSIFFIVIQPIMLGTWCTLCLIAAAAMLIQIPYSVDELVATGEFLWRRKREGESPLRIFFTGDTDEGEVQPLEDEFARPPSAVLKDIFSGGITLPWNLACCLLIGVWLMCTRITLGAAGSMADADHLIGSLVLTVTVTALAECARALRLLNMPLGAALLMMPLLLDTTLASAISSVACGLTLILLSIRKGTIRGNYGEAQHLII